MVRILAKLFIIFILVYAGVSIWYGRLEEKLLQDSVSRVAADVPPPEKKTEILRKPDDYTIIVSRNIFQAVVVKTEPDTKDVPPEELMPTKLKLSLMGTISGNERDARAIISDDAKRAQDIYQVGDSVQGATIKTIERGKVVLTLNGKDEVLTLKDREGGGTAYQPSPADFYQEPPEPPELQGAPEPQDLQGQQEQAEPPELQEAPEPPEASEALEPSEPQFEGAPSTPAVRQPVVRPRPVRRRVIPRNPASGIDQPGME